MLTIDACKEKLELTRRAALLSLLRFEQKMNSDGQNQAHLYEDQRKSLVKANRHRVNEVILSIERLLKNCKCKKMGGVTDLTDLNNLPPGFVLTWEQTNDG